jgi:hypothetical protein
VLLGQIDGEDHLRGYFGLGLDSPSPNWKIARVRPLPGPNPDTEAANGSVIPQQPLCFGKAFDESAERPYSGVRSRRALGNLEMRAVFSALPSDAEDNHFRPEGLYKRLKVAR